MEPVSLWTRVSATFSEPTLLRSERLGTAAPGEMLPSRICSRSSAILASQAISSVRLFALMGFWADEAEVEIVAIAGVLRVSIRPRLGAASLSIMAAAIVGFAALLISSWQHASRVERILGIGTVVGAVLGWFRQFSGSEEGIEIGERGIRISREIFGWHKVSEYPIEGCSNLDLNPDNEDSSRLQFRFGRWRTIEFGSYMSEEQAKKVLDTLADSLPAVAGKLLPSLDITKHWTTLGLS